MVKGCLLIEHSCWWVGTELRDYCQSCGGECFIYCSYRYIVAVFSQAADVFPFPASYTDSVLVNGEVLPIMGAWGRYFVIPPKNSEWREVVLVFKSDPYLLESGPYCCSSNWQKSYTCF